MSKFKKWISVCSAAVLGLNLTAVTAAEAAASGIVINEVCAKNTQYAAADGNFYDWIELYNPTGSAIDLGGYGLSDNEANPYKFTFPANTIVNGGGRLIVFCDSKIDGINGQLVAPMGLSTSGETVTLTDKGGNPVDVITFGNIETNISYGRVTDGASEFAYMNMTPNAPNQKNDVIDIDVAEPVFSKDSGFYNGGFSLSIDVPQGTKVYYTLDGSTPTAASTQYNSPIQVSDKSSSPNVFSAITNIVASGGGGFGGFGGGGGTPAATPPSSLVDKAFIINAVAIDAQGNVSDTVSASYFIDLENKKSYYKDMKVISIVTDGDNLFDYEKGIYVLGKTYDDWKNGPDYSPMTQEWEIPANYTQKGAAWERPASMQVFENGQLAHSQNVGLRIHGGATRSAAQKSFNVYSRSEYGASKFEFDLFSGKVVSEFKNKIIKKFDSFMLRNAGNDGQYTRFRDKLNQMLVADRNMLSQGMEPAVVFINGEFWGHYEITEKLDEEYVDAHFDVGKKNVCIVKNGELDAGKEETFAEWEQLDKWVQSTNMADASNYKQLCEKVDIQSFIDYVSAEVYFGNNDWGNNNYALWKAVNPVEGNEYSDGRWRFILFDTEYSVNLYGQIPANTNTFNQLLQKDCFLTHMLRAAMNNEEFKRQFCTTFMDMANENFNEQRVMALISELSGQYHDVSVDTHDRFWPPATTTTTTTTAPGQTTTQQPAGPGFPGGGWGGIGGGGGWGDWGGGFGGQQTAEQNYTSQVDTVKSFYQSRFQSITGSLRNFGSLKGNMANITVKNSNDKGSVKINTVTPSFENGSWSGKYYTDYPITLKATPKQGYRFSYWETSTGEKITSMSAEISFTSDMTVTAVYEQGGGNDVLVGDINDDGSVDAADLVLLQKYIMGKGTLTSDQAKRADVNNDNRINTFDTAVMRKLVTK